MEHLFIWHCLPVGRTFPKKQERPQTGAPETAMDENTTSSWWGVLHYNSAAPHKARARVHFLEVEMLQILPHPLYSPDFAPSDCWLIIFYFERWFCKKRIQDLAKAANSQLWLRRLKNCEHERRVVLENLRKCHFCKSWSYVITCKTCGLPLIAANCLARQACEAQLAMFWTLLESAADCLSALASWRGLVWAVQPKVTFRQKLFKQPTSRQGRVHRQEQNSILTSKQ